MPKPNAPADVTPVVIPRRGSQSASRALAILNLIATEGRPMSLTQIASRLALAKSSTSSLLVSLEASGLVRRSENHYSLDFGVIQLAGGFLLDFDLVAEVKHLVQSFDLLRDQIIQIAVLTGRDVTYLGRHLGRSPLPVTASVGDRYPAANTAVGMALLAELDDQTVREMYSVPDAFSPWTGRSTRTLPQLLAKLHQTREQGYSIDRGETHPTVLGLGVRVKVHGNSDNAQSVALSASLRPTTIPKREQLAVVEQLWGLRDALEVVNILH